VDAELTDERLSICDWVIVATRPRRAVEYVQSRGRRRSKGRGGMDVVPG
jgi:hypothetical protein